MIYCNNSGCRHCSINLEVDGLVCTLDEASFITVATLQGWMLKCNSYKYRPAGEAIQPNISPGLGADGLYPGQIKPPMDYTDFDPEEIIVPPPVVAAVLTDQGDYPTVEPECDT
jgi:hypothetical protein